MTTNPNKSESSELQPAAGQATHEWLKLTAVAAASALAGGLAAAWWHRKTLVKLRQEGQTGTNPHFRITDGDPNDEL
jgi:hypothetical protein